MSSRKKTHNPLVTDLVYKFGCRPPREPALALQLLGQASNYAESLRLAYNDIKRELRELFGAGPDDHDLIESGDDVSHVLKRLAWRRRNDETSHVVARLYDIQRELVRLARKPDRRGHLIDAGTYWLVEAAMIAASKAMKLDPIGRERWEATGRIGAAIQSNSQFNAKLPWTHSRVRLSAPNAKGHAELTIIVGDMRDPREITWPIKLHRSFPDGAIIKQVAVQRVRCGHRYVWEAITTIAVPVVERDVDASGVVGVDVGWRTEAQGQRVATHDAADDVGDLHIDTAAAYAYCDAVQEFRDTNFNDAKDYAAREKIPGAEFARLWKDKSRMHRLAETSGDLGVTMWHERDKHLEDIECGVRTRAIRRRLDAFRCYANTLAKRYKILVLEDMPMADWVGKSPTSPTERARSTAALSLLQNVLAQRFGPSRVDWVPAQYTSMKCSECHTVRAKTVGPKAHWTCETCGKDHHQDRNAAVNLRVLGERWRDAGNPVRARKRKTVKKKGEKGKDAIGSGNEVRMIVTARKPTAEAAE